jgi:hypothetical protein
MKRSPSVFARKTMLWEMSVPIIKDGRRILAGFPGVSKVSG